MLFSNLSALLLCFAVTLLLASFNFINSVFLSSSIWSMLFFIPLAFCPSIAIFLLSKKQRYLITKHLCKIKKYHIPAIIYSILLLIFGSLFLKFIFIDGQYTAFSLYNTFFAKIDGGFAKQLYLLLTFCIIPPIFEGIIYRGILIKEYDKRGRMCATLVSSTLYALLGFDFSLVPQRFFMGALLCILLYATSSIIVSISANIIYNIFALYFEPIFISLKKVSANANTFSQLILIASLIMATCLCSHLFRLYKKYSKDKNYLNFKKSTPRERTFWHLVELLLSAPALSCYVLFLVTVAIINI